MAAPMMAMVMSTARDVWRDEGVAVELEMSVELRTGNVRFWSVVAMFEEVVDAFLELVNLVWRE